MCQNAEILKNREALMLALVLFSCFISLLSSFILVFILFKCFAPEITNLVFNFD